MTAAVHVHVADAADQELVVEAAGEDVGYLAGVAPPDVDEEAVMPDWVGLVARVVNLGMMSAAESFPGASRATVTETTIDAAARTARWRLTLEQTDPGVLRVLLTLLRARRLTTVTLQTTRAPLGAGALDPARLPWPAAGRALPFPVEREQPLRSTRGRQVAVEFVQPLDDVPSEAAIAALDAWGTLLVLAGYASPDRDPQESQTLPDPPFWLDEATVVQTFGEFFDADDACFDAVVNWAARAHRAGTPVRAVRIR